MVRDLCASYYEDKFVEEPGISQGTALLNMKQLKAYLCINDSGDWYMLHTIEYFCTRRPKQCKIQTTITSYSVFKN